MQGEADRVVGKGSHDLRGAPLKIEAGTVVVVEDNEAQRLAAVKDSDALDALRALGYVE